MIFVYSFFCPEYFTQLPPPFFSRSTTVELQPWCNSQKKAFLHFPGSAPLGAVLPRHLRTRLQHTSKGKSIPLQGKGRGPSCSFSHLLWAYHWQTTNVVYTALKLGRPPRSLGGETSYLLIKQMIRITLWIKRFLVRNLKRKSKVLALEIKSWSGYLARTKLVNLSEPCF